ncbi:MAG: sigma-70 family RNA polymerase sigma factor [Planctomycetota bacterium]
MAAPNHPSLEHMLKDLDRVRGMARSLVRDAAAADDLVQDAVVVALRNRRSRAGVEVDSAEAYARATLRNLSRNSARGQRHRTWRESEAARPEAQPSALEGAERAELCRNVSGAVLDLDEPYRTVVLMRFFEDLAPRKIAARTGAPVETVKKQLARGQRELQRRLESRYGDRGAWAVALLPLTGPGVLGAAKALGGSGFVFRVLAVVALLGSGGAWLGTLRESQRAAPDLEVEQVALIDVAAEVPTARPAANALREKVALVEPSDESPATALANDGEAGDAESNQPDPRGNVFRGRVIDAHGRPLAGLRIEWVNEGKRKVRAEGLMTMWETLPKWLQRRESIVTDGDGAFEIDRYPAPEKRSIRWSYPDSDLQQLMSGKDSGGVDVRILSPSVKVAGIVRDEDGRPVAGAHLTLDRSLLRVEGFPRDLEHLAAATFTAETDRRGRFRLRMAAHPSAELRVARSRSDQRALARVAIPEAGVGSLDVVIPSVPERPLWSVHGVVLDDTGDPVGGALVACGRREMRADGEGRSRFEERSGYEDGQRMLAQHADLRFTVTDAPAADAAFAPGGAGPIELRLPARSLRLRGQLVDADGAPLVGWKLCVLDGTFLRGSYVRYEHFRRGYRPEEPYVTGPRGVFTITNVLDRPYDLRFLDPESLAFVDETAVSPSAGPVRVTFPSASAVVGLRGRVTDVFGQPVPEARVSFSVPTGIKEGRVRTLDSRELAVTDGTGSFDAPDGTWCGQRLSIRPSHLSDARSTEFALTRGEVRASLDLQVELECAVELDGSGATEVDAVRFLTDEGSVLRVVTNAPGRRIGGTLSRRNEAGRFSPMRVSQRATVMVLLRDGEEVDRQAVRLRPYDINELAL